MAIKLLYKENYMLVQHQKNEPFQKREILNNLALRYGVSLHSLEHPFLYSFAYSIGAVVMLLVGILIVFALFSLDDIIFEHQVIMVALSSIFIVLSFMAIIPVYYLHKYKKIFMLEEYQKLIQQGEVTEARILSNFYESPMVHRIDYEMLTPKGELVKANYLTESLEKHSIRINEKVYLLYLNPKINTLL